MKEKLAQNAISQRLFAATVLGLSQGSLSDLLGRPKPWHLLKERGQTPYIRMQMFLEDENAVAKLRPSHYKVSPEKLASTGAAELAENLELPSLQNTTTSSTISKTGPVSGGSQEERSIFEAALTQDLDTQVIATKVQELLEANSIGQKVSFFKWSPLLLLQIQLCWFDNL